MSPGTRKGNEQVLIRRFSDYTVVCLGFELDLYL